MRAPVERASLAPGVEIPRIINGCWQLASDHRRRRQSLAESTANLQRLAELGLTTFDCADIYTGVEERLGALRRHWTSGGRDPGALRIHTKFVPDAGRLATIDRSYVREILDRSRERLGAPRLDLVQFHWWDFAVPGWLETGRWLDELRAEGRIRLLGVTNFDVPHLERLLAAGLPIASNQVQYSLLDRRPAAAMAELCRQHGVRLLTYGALAGGFLSDRWLDEEDPGMDVGNRSLTKYRLIIDEFGGWEAFQRLLGSLHRIARKHRVSIANVATRWVLDRPGVTAVILGASDAAHGEDNLRTFSFALDARDRQRIAALLADHPGPDGDIYSVERIPGGRHASIMKTDLNRAPSAPKDMC